MGRGLRSRSARRRALPCLVLRLLILIASWITATRDTDNNIPKLGHHSPKSLTCYLVVPSATARRSVGPGLPELVSPELPAFAMTATAGAAVTSDLLTCVRDPHRPRAHRHLDRRPGRARPAARRRVLALHGPGHRPQRLHHRRSAVPLYRLFGSGASVRGNERSRWASSYVT